MKSGWLARFHWLLLVAALLSVSLGLFAYKSSRLGYPIVPDTEAEIWTVEARVDVVPDGGRGALVSLQLPHNAPGFAVMNEQFVSRRFGLSVETEGHERKVTWAQRRPQARQALYYRATVYREQSERGDSRSPRFPSPPQLDEPFATAMDALLTDVREQSADIASFASEVLRRINTPAPDENLQLFLADVDGRLGRARLAAKILAGARIPTRIVHGLTLGANQTQAEPQAWLEVHNGNRWIVFDPVNASRGLPDNVLIWWRGDRPPVTTEGILQSSWQFSVVRNFTDPLQLAEHRSEVYGSRASDFSLLALPLQTQQVYSVLIMIPIGALLIALLRNVVGIKTFGTFMPVLIAMAFRETQLLAGVILFVLITSVGLLFRFYLERLRLLLVPRLTAVLIAVLALLMITSMVSHQMGIEVGLSVSLFPMVILAMVIERMSIVWEERGPSEAVQQAAGSLLVAALAYLLMGVTLLQHLFFIFPELIFAVLALTIVLGRYTGFRLTELSRFRELTGRS